MIRMVFFHHAIIMRFSESICTLYTTGCLVCILEGRQRGPFVWTVMDKGSFAISQCVHDSDPKVLIKVYVIRGFLIIRLWLTVNLFKRGENLLQKCYFGGFEKLF